MYVELLVVPEGPNEVSALDLTRAALDELDVSASVIRSVIESDEHAQARGFTGSPSRSRWSNAAVGPVADRPQQQ